MFTPAPVLFVDGNQRKDLTRLVGSGKTPQKIALRARIILMAAEGTPNNTIARQLVISRPTVILWRGRFAEGGVQGILQDAPRPGRRKALGPDVVTRVVQATMQTTPPAATPWSVRSMAQAQGLSRMTVQRIWKQQGLQPHRVENFKFSKDPRLVEKLRDVVGLYLNPPERALVLSVDEKSPIQALDRTPSLLPLRPGIPARQSHDYKRHGTTTRFAALSMLDGKVIGQGRPRHRSAEFVRFLKKIDQDTPGELDLHLIADHYSTHKSPMVKRGLVRHKRFHLHFVPTGSSWLNRVERWFEEITRKRIRRGTFQSVRQLLDAITEYLENYNGNPVKFTWTKDADMILAKIDRYKEASGTAQ